jgi:putative transcriptional regulator
VFKAGQILVSHPSLEDGLFSKSVVLITEHSLHGTSGIILNKPSRFKMHQVVEDLHYGVADHTLYHGGPISQNSLLIIHTGEWYSSNTISLPTDISITSDHFMFEKINMGNFPDRFRFVTGMSAWQANQLQEEIERDTWLICEADHDLLFEHAGITMWRKAVELCASQSVANFF